jgi:hypothetical protein
MGKKDNSDKVILIYILSQQLQNERFQLSSSLEVRSTTKLKVRTQTPKSLKLLKLLVRCGVTLIQLQRVVLKPNIKKTKYQSQKRNKNTNNNMARSKERKRRKELRKNPRRNDFLNSIDLNYFISYIISCNNGAAYR